MDNKEYAALVNEGKFPESVQVPLDAPFVDERGVIQNIWLGNCGSVTFITTKAGSIRADHIHHGNDFHGSYIISGEIKYSYLNTNGVVVEHIYKSGQMFFSPPEVWHKMEFPVDTTFITVNNIVKNHKNYEETIERAK